MLLMIMCCFLPGIIILIIDYALHYQPWYNYSGMHLFNNNNYFYAFFCNNNNTGIINYY